MIDDGGGIGVDFGAELCAKPGYGLSRESLRLEAANFSLRIAQLALQFFVGVAINKLPGGTAFGHDSLLGVAAAVSDGIGDLAVTKGSILGSGQNGSVHAAEALAQALLDASVTGCDGRVQTSKALIGGIDDAAEALASRHVGGVLPLNHAQAQPIDTGLDAGEGIKLGSGTMPTTLTGNDHSGRAAAGIAAASRTSKAVPVAGKAVAPPRAEQGTGKSTDCITPAPAGTVTVDRIGGN